jgi:hypothetical protein
VARTLLIRPDMRTHRLASIPTPTLADVTGGCHKHGPPPQAMQQQQEAAAAGPANPRVQVQVATGQQGGQAIQQALSGGAFSAS